MLHINSPTRPVQVCLPPWEFLCNFVNERLELSPCQLSDGERESEIFARELLDLAREMSIHYCQIIFIALDGHDTAFLYVCPKTSSCAEKLQQIFNHTQVCGNRVEEHNNIISI
jgi:hypothetical protein